MRILCLYGKSPVPDQTGNRRRLLRLLTAVAARHEVLLLVADRAMTDADHVALATADLPRVQIIHLVPAAIPFGVRLRWLAGRGLPLGWQGLDLSAARTEIQAAIDTFEPDVIWSSSTVFTDVLLRDTAVPVVVDVSHIERVAIDRHLDAALHQRPLRLRDLRRAARVALDRGSRLRAEVRALDACHLLLPVSEVEADAAAASSSTRTEIIPNGVDLPDDLGWQPGSRQILSVANFSYPPNAEALDLLTSQVLPVLQAFDPAVELHLVGPGIATDHPVRTIPGVVVHGFVPDLAGPYRTAELVVAPLMSGSGTKIKVLEAFGYGVPLVTTPVGAEGLDVEHGREVRIGDSASAVAAECLRLLQDPELAGRQRDAARAWVREGSSWTAIGDRFCAALESVPSTAPGS